MYSSNNYIYETIDVIVRPAKTVYIISGNIHDSIPKNLKDGSGQGSIVQKVFDDNSKNAIASALGAVALGGQKYDDPTAVPTKALGRQSLAGGGSSEAWHNWCFAYGMNATAYMGGSAAFNAARAGMTEEEFLQKYPQGVDGSGRAWSDNANCFAFAANVSTAKGWASFAMNYAAADGDNSFAQGDGTDSYWGRSVGRNSASFNRSRSTGQNSFAANLNTEALANNSTTFGLYNKTLYPDSLICGRYCSLNQVDSADGKILFAVGNGKSDSERNSILQVFEDKVKITSSPVFGHDVLRYEDMGSTWTWNNANNVSTNKAKSAGFTKVFADYIKAKELNVFGGVGEVRIAKLYAELVQSSGRVVVSAEPTRDFDAIRLIDFNRRIPEAPTANGTYVLQAVRTSSGVTYSWVAK